MNNMVFRPRDRLIPIDHSGLHAPPGTREWIITQRSLMITCLSDIRNNLHVARLTYADIQKSGGWQHLKDESGQPFETFERFCESNNGLRLSKEEIEERLRLGKHGGDRKSENAQNQGSKNTTLIGRGRGYTLRRLNRDRPDLAERVRAGKLSANAAAIEAGFRKKRKKLSPLDQMRKLMPKLTAEERHLLADELMGSDHREIWPVDRAGVAQAGSVRAG